MRLLTLLGLAPLVLSSPPANAAQQAVRGDEQADEQAEFRTRYEEKIAKEFVSHGGWMLDYVQARERAKAEKKLLFIYFTRSYAG